MGAVGVGIRAGFSEDHPSINGTANAFVELAGLLHSGRVDLDTGTLSRVRHAHPDVAAAVADFASKIDDRGEDAVLLLSALATRLRDTAQGYAHADATSQSAFDTLLSHGTFAPGAGTGM